MKTILVDAVNTFVIKDEGIFEEMYDLLEEYPNSKIVVTNANDEQIDAFGLDAVPYDLFTLKHNPEKTDPTYFETLLETYRLKVQDVIYFEHNPQAVQSAESLGIHTYHYDPVQKDLEKLKNFLDSSL